MKKLILPLNDYALFQSFRILLEKRIALYNAEAALLDAIEFHYYGEEEGSVSDHPVLRFIVLGMLTVKKEGAVLTLIAESEGRMIIKVTQMSAEELAITKGKENVFVSGNDEEMDNALKGVCDALDLHEKQIEEAKA